MAKNKFIILVMVMVAADGSRTVKAPQLGEEAIYLPGGQVLVKSGTTITAFNAVTGERISSGLPIADWDAYKGSGVFVSGNTALPQWLQDGKVYSGKIGVSGTESHIFVAADGTTYFQSGRKLSPAQKDEITRSDPTGISTAQQSALQLKSGGVVAALTGEEEATVRGRIAEFEENLGVTADEFWTAGIAGPNDKEVIADAFRGLPPVQREYFITQWQKNHAGQNFLSGMQKQLSSEDYRYLQA